MSSRVTCSTHGASQVPRLSPRLCLQLLHLHGLKPPYECNRGRQRRASCLFLTSVGTHLSVSSRKTSLALPGTFASALSPSHSTSPTPSFFYRTISSKMSSRISSALKRNTEDLQGPTLQCTNARPTRPQHRRGRSRQSTGQARVRWRLPGTRRREQTSSPELLDAAGKRAGLVLQQSRSGPREGLTRSRRMNRDKRTRRERNGRREATYRRQGRETGRTSDCSATHSAFCSDACVPERHNCGDRTLTS